MATFRVGIGSFNINDGAVGIGTEGTGHGNLKVEGTIKSTKNLDVLGVSTFTRYSGFNADEVNVNNRDLTLSGEYSTTGDIVVEDGASLTVGLGSTACVGSVECISVKHHFSVPVGDTAQRNETSGYGEGTVRYNRDLGTMEFFNGNEWRQFTYIADIQNSPSSRGRGLIGGGATPADNNKSNLIEYIQISTLGNATNFGQLTDERRYVTSCASNTRGIFAGGEAPGNTDIIEYVTIASEGNAIDFGNLTDGRSAMAGLSSQTRGIFTGGYDPVQNTIDYIEINTLGNAIDFGDTTNSGQYASGCSSPVRGIYQGHTENDSYKFYDQITIASKGNAITWGEVNFLRTAASMASNSVRGINAGGYNALNPYFSYIVSSIEYITIASAGSAEYFGDLTTLRSNSFNGCATNTRVVFCGGTGDTQHPNATHMDSCEFVTIASSGNGQNFGDLSGKRRALGQCSDSHGGLGGY